MTAPTVDVHAHVMLPEAGALVAGRPGFAGARAPDARRNGAAALAVSGSMVRERMPRMTDSGVRLAAMDAQRVDVQLISPSPSHYHYWADEETAEKVCRLANEATAAHCSAAPDRLRGLGLVPLQHPDLMVRALDDALDQGLGRSGDFQPRSGAGTHRSGLRAFWARAEATGALVFLRPFGCTLDERLDRWYLPNTVGQPTENAVALSHLVFSGVLDRHPGLKPVAAHGGGCLPTHIGRGDEGRPRPLQGQGHRHHPRPPPRHGRRAGPVPGRRRFPASRPDRRDQRPGRREGPAVQHELDVRGDDRLRLPRGTRVVPGDVLGSGTCGNGGCLAELWGLRGERTPPPLRPGDTVSPTVEGLGTLTNTVVPRVEPVPLPAARRRARERP